MRGDVNKLFVLKKFVDNPQQCFALTTFLPIISIFTEGEGDGIKSRLPFKIVSTLFRNYLLSLLEFTPIIMSLGKR